MYWHYYTVFIQQKKGYFRLLFNLTCQLLSKLYVECILFFLCESIEACPNSKFLPIYRSCILVVEGRKISRNTIKLGHFNIAKYLFSNKDVIQLSWFPKGLFKSCFFFMLFFSSQRQLSTQQRIATIFDQFYS